MEITGVPGVLAVTSDGPAALDAARRVAASAVADEVVAHVATGGDGFAGVVRAAGDGRALAELLAPVADLGLYRTATRHLRRHRTRWPAGEPTPGVGSIYRVRRHPDLDARAFHTHWETTHGPLALRRHLGMWDYRQVSLAEPLTAGAPDADGIAVVQWPTAEDLTDRFFDGDEGRDAIVADARSFTGGTDRVLMREHVLIDAPLPTGRSFEIADFFQQPFPVPAERVWALVAAFGDVLDWWPPGGLVDCRTEGSDGAGQVRVLTRPDGTTVTERLDDLRPGERMLHLSVVDGFPGPVVRYDCRYEVRSTGPGTCRLDWYPSALVEPAGAAVFAAIVDHGWRSVSSGLLRAVGAADPQG